MPTYKTMPKFEPVTFSQFFKSLGQGSSAGQKTTDKTYQTPSGEKRSLFNIPAGPQSMVPTTQPTSAPVTQPQKNMGSTATPTDRPTTNTFKPVTDSSGIPQQFINPKTGGLYTPEEYANNVASSLPGQRGDIPQNAGDQFTQRNQTSEQLQSTAAGLNNTRNDIAVGETDPYKVGAESGAQYSPQELAAIEKAYSGVYDPAINTALAKLEKQQKAEEPFTLGKDQVRYDGSGNIIATGGGSDSTGVSSAEVLSWAKAIDSNNAKLSDVPQEIRTSVVAQLGNSSGGVSSPKQQAALDKSTVALTALEDIFKNPALTRGALNRRTATIFPGSNATDLNASVDTLKTLIGFDALQKMRDASPTGGALGQVSEREIDFLQSVAGSLSTKQSDEQLIKNLKDVQKSFQVLKLINSLDGTEGVIDDIPFIKSGERLIFQAPDGQTFERLPDGNLQKASFKPVGNTKVSTSGQGNLPQRNNNPGNVKRGGLADNLAVGRDSQGHLIFPDAETGFKALTLDLTAKVNGASKYLPENPTIAQLGKVYAEDPAWSNSVAKILGVSPTTPTKNIPITRLAQAIARQEGFYS